MNEKRPLIITFIGDISILIALLSILTFILPNYFEKLGFHINPLPVFSDGIMNILMPIVLLIASYGYLKLKRWGYWLLVIYNVFFLLVNITYWSQNKQMFISMGFISTVLELIFIIPTRKYFIKNVTTSKNIL